MITDIFLFVAKGVASFALSKGLGKAFDTREDFEQRLYTIILEAIDKYEKSNPLPDEDGKFAFYKSQIIVEEFLKYRLFAEEGYEINEIQIQNALDRNPNILKPTDEQLLSFFKIFDEVVAQDNKIKNLEIDAFYKQKIFVISSKIDSVIKLLELHLIETVGLLEEEYKGELEICYKDILSLKFQTALVTLLAIEERIERNAKHVSDKLKSDLIFYKALCYESIGDSQESFKLFVRAHKLNSENPKYLNRACISYYFLKDPKYKELIPVIQSTDDYNIECWAINTFESEDIIAYLQNNVPQNVLENHRFKRLIFNHNAITSKVDNIDLLNILLKDNISYDIPTIINYDNFYHWLFILNAVTFRYFNHVQIIFNIEKEISEQKAYYYNLSKTLSDAIYKGEFGDTYNAIHFFRFWLESEIELNHKTLEELKKAYSLLNPKDSLKALLCANSIQKFGVKQDALIFINEQKHLADDNLTFLKIYTQLQIPDSVINVEELFENFKLIDNYRITQICSNLEFIIKSKEYNHDLLLGCINNAVYEKPVYKDLLLLLVRSLRKEENISIDEINSIKDTLKDDTNLNIDIAVLYFENGFYAECADFIKTYLDETKVTKDLFLYIEALNLIKTGSQTELLRVLKLWRINKFFFNDKFLRLEIELRQMLKDWESIIEIALFALQTLPKDEAFFTIYISSLAQLNNAEEIQKLLPNINSFNFTNTSYALTICSILFHFNHFETAIEIIYQKAKNPDDTVARTKYFNLQRDFPPEFLVEYEVVIDDSFVRFEIDGQSEIKHIIQGSKNPLIVNSLGKAKNETFTIGTTFSGKIRSAKVIRIMNKYLALADELYFEANSAFSQLPLESIHFEDDNIKSFEEKFVETFGTQESERRKFIESKLSDYYKYSIFFGELVGSNFNGFYIDAYYSLTSDQSNGFLILPLNQIEKDISIEDKGLVIDFTSSLLFYELQKKLDLKFEPFVVAQNLLEFVEYMILKAKEDSKSTLSVSIIDNKVVPHFYDAKFHETRIELLQSFLNWLQHNAKGIMPEEKIDLMRPLYEEGKVEPHFECMIDTAFLAQRDNYILLSDDISYRKLLPFLSSKIMSTEGYLISKFPERKNEIYEHLLLNRYVGLEISREILFNSYINHHKQGFEHLYQYAVRNATLRENFQVSNIEVIIGFLKDLALSVITPEQYKIEATHIFTLTLTCLSDQRQIIALKENLEQEFSLIQNKLIVTQLALLDALRIRGNL